jgi:delta-aminolevulinic acid dehydratase/porphobilinogen synthase
VYKIITKIIATGIKTLLSFGISKEQFGFLEGRQITDAIGVVQETLHRIKVKNIKALVLKIDLIKAYDKLDWGFLRLVLL